MADEHSVASESPAIPHTPLPINEPAPSYLDSPKIPPSALSPRDSFTPSVPISTRSSALLQSDRKYEWEEREPPEALPPSATAKKGRRPIVPILIGLGVLAVVVLAVILPVYFTVIKPKGQKTNITSSSSGSEPSPGGTGQPESPTSATSGGDGSTVITEDGSTFVYSNKFGGFWVSDPNDPFNNNAQPNSWTPPLNQTWTWGKDRVFGVNIGGLFVLEPFISPALFQKYPGARDEWSLSERMAADTASGGLAQLEEHYKTFITEKDIAEIAGAGLNWIRLPIPYWAINTWPGEPFLPRTSWKYILRLFGWCRKYGLRIYLDLHTIPGSQNAYDHSGKADKINFLNGVMGLANAQRALEIIRVITEFISQPQYKDVIRIFGVMNEPVVGVMGREALSGFYLEAHNMIRNISGYGEGNGPYIAIHDGFGGLASWADFLPGSDRVILDTHPYFAFDGSPALSPVATGTGNNAGGVWPGLACNRLSAGMDASRSNFGITIAGEFSNAINDCALYLKGIPERPSSYGGDCSVWQDSTNWSAATKAGLMRFAMASMDSLGDFFFWTWKVGNTTRGIVESPLWSYQLGLRNGWMPTDPRTAKGVCDTLRTGSQNFDGKYKSWQTGGAGAGTIAPSVMSQFPWPPTAISNAGAPIRSLPVYTATGTVVTLPPPTLSPSPTKSVNVGNGWFNAQDTAPAPTPIAGCSYPDPWDAIGVEVPPACGADASKRSIAATAEDSVITSPPTL